MIAWLFRWIMRTFFGAEQRAADAEADVKVLKAERDAATKPVEPMRDLGHDF